MKSATVTPTVDNGLVRDKRLSFRARGIAVYLLSMKDDWRINSDQIADAGMEGRDAVRGALKELENLGYLRRRKCRGKDGKIVTKSVLFEVPQEVDEQAHGDENTDDGFSGVGFSGVGFSGPFRKPDKKEHKEYAPFAWDKPMPSPHSANADTYAGREDVTSLSANREEKRGADKDKKAGSSVGIVDAVNVNGESIDVPLSAKSQRRKSKAKKEDSPQEVELKARTKAIFDAYVGTLENFEPGFIVNRGATGAAARALAEKDFTPEQVTQAVLFLKKDKFWGGANHLSLMAVATRIAAIVANVNPATGQNKPTGGILSRMTMLDY